MKAKEKKKALILGGLIAVLAIYWGFTLFGGGKKPASAPARPAATKKAAVKGQAAIKVDLDLLKRPREQYEASRNIFSPIYRKPEMPKPLPVLAGRQGKGAAGMKPLPPLPPPPPPKSPKEIAIENAREEMRRIKVVGFLKQKGRIDIFMTLDDGNYIVEKGGNITKQYFVDKINKDSILVSDKNTGVQVSLAADFTGKAASATLPSPGVGGPSGPSRRAPQPYGGGRPGYPGAAPRGRSISVQGGSQAYNSLGGVAAQPAPPPQPPEPFSEGLTSHSVN